MHLGMVAVMNAAIALEDPFVTDGVDGVYCSETLFEVEQVGYSSQTPLSKYLILAYVYRPTKPAMILEHSTSSGKS